MIRRRRAYASVAVGRGSGDATLEAREHCKGDRVTAVFVNERATGQTVLEPESPRVERPGLCDVNDQRPRRGALLEREDSGHGVGIRRVGSEPVHGLRRHDDELACAEASDGLIDLVPHTQHDSECCP